MIKELYIKNMAVIAELRVPLSHGFQVFTGDTGAGKSILVEAIGLILGMKASQSLIRDHEEEALVEAVFDITKNKKIAQLLQDEDLLPLEDPQEMIIKRVINRQGKSKIFINHQRTNLSFLQKVSQHLIDFTGQYQQIELFDSKNDIYFLDAFLETPEKLNEYKKLFLQCKEVHQKIQELDKASLEKTEKLDWLEFQLKELNQLTLETEVELEALKDKKNLLKNSKKITDFLQKVQGVLTDRDHSVRDQTAEILQQIQRETFLQEICQNMTEKLINLQTLAEDISYDFSKIEKQQDFSSGHATEEIEDQIFKTTQLKRKYGPTVEDVVLKRQSLLEEKELFTNIDQDLQKLKKQFVDLFHQLKVLAQHISSDRHNVRATVQSLILAELKFLKMPQVEFIINITALENGVDFNEFGLNGFDKVQFLLSTNPGLKPKPLAEIASGGEASRILLAIKQVLHRIYTDVTFVFDEIDTGISGAVVELVGKKLKELSQRFQVICVTHHAQIAGMADQHFYIHKVFDHQRTETKLTQLNTQERIQEVARLMGGTKITQKNLDFAKELLKPYLHE